MKFPSLPLFIFVSILLFKKFKSSFAQTSSTCLKFECNDDWATRTDSDGKANALCRDQCAEVVSIHSAEENEFVRTVAKPLLDDCQNEIICKSRPNETSEDFNRILHSFFIGMHRVQHSRLERCTRDENAYCIWSDMTECDFGNYTGVIGPHETSPPWATGNPNGIVYPLYAIEDCVEFYDSTNGYWNDVPCNFRLSGVICKRDCASYCVDQDTQLMF